VRKSSGPDGSTRLITAPFVDREGYLEGMEWKRRVHREHGTVLIETYSYEAVEGGLTEALAEKLAPYTTPEPTEKRIVRRLGAKPSVHRDIRATIRRLPEPVGSTD
jgi:DNA helicase-4